MTMGSVNKVIVWNTANACNHLVCVTYFFLNEREETYAPKRNPLFGGLAELPLIIILQPLRETLKTTKRSIQENQTRCDLKDQNMQHPIFFRNSLKTPSETRNKTRFLHLCAPLTTYTLKSFPEFPPPKNLKNPKKSFKNQIDNDDNDDDEIRLTKGT